MGPQKSLRVRVKNQPTTDPCFGGALHGVSLPWVLTSDCHCWAASPVAPKHFHTHYYRWLVFISPVWQVSHGITDVPRLNSIVTYVFVSFETKSH